MPAVASGDTLMYACVNVSSIASYTRMTAQVWGLTFPTPNNRFVSDFEAMYAGVAAARRTPAAKALHSYFGCRAPRMPIGATDELWQLQYYETGLTLSPPPPGEC